jgi:hypothetical protein
MFLPNISRHYRIAFALFVVLLSAYSIFPCSIPSIPPARFDTSQYIFVGEVIGYVETTEMIDKRQTQSETEMYGELAGKTAGISVRVRQAFYTPAKLKQEYEVYQFSLGADCGLYGLPLAWMKERYKIGDSVRIVAGKSTHIAQPNDKTSERLEVRYGKDDWITPIGNDDPAFHDLSSVFDYNAYRSNFTGDLYFELLKDLRRLSLANNTERREILDRLTYYPRLCDNCLFFLEDVFKTYSADKAELARFSSLVHKRAMTDVDFKQFIERKSKNNQ